MWNPIKSFFKININNIYLTTNPPYSNIPAQSSNIFSICKTVDLLLIKPYCLIVNKLLTTKNWTRPVWSLIIDSNDLHIILVKLIGLLLDASVYFTFFVDGRNATGSIQADIEERSLHTFVPCRWILDKHKSHQTCAHHLILFCHVTLKFLWTIYLVNVARI